MTVWLKLEFLHPKQAPAPVGYIESPKFQRLTSNRGLCFRLPQMALRPILDWHWAARTLEADEVRGDSNLPAG